MANRTHKTTLTTLACFLFTITGCYYKPWSNEEYVVSKGPSASYIGESILQYPEHTVAGVVFQVSLCGSNVDSYEHGPYKIHISAWEERRRSQQVQIESAWITLEDGTRLVCATNEMPVALSFEKHSDMLAVAFFNSQERFALSPRNKQRVFVTIRVHVQLDGKSTQKDLSYEFFPRITRGKLRLLVTA